MQRGVPLSAALSVVETVQRSTEYVARAFVKLFLDEVYKPFDAAGAPAERLPDVIEAVERLRPIASQVLLAVFQQTMSAESRRRSAKSSSAPRSAASARESASAEADCRSASPPAAAIKPQRAGGAAKSLLGV